MSLKPSQKTRTQTQFNWLASLISIKLSSEPISCYISIRSIKLKTTLFSRVDVVRNDEFKKDIQLLLKLKEDGIYKTINNICNKITDNLEDFDVISLIDQISVDCKISFDDSKDILSMLDFFINALGANGFAQNDSEEDLAQDLLSVKIITADQESKLLNILKNIKSNTGSEFATRKNEQRYRETGIPRIEYINSTVELKAVLNEEYEKNIDLSNYNPEILSLIPTATLELILTDGAPIKNIYLQLDEKSIRRVINNLSAIEKQLLLISGKAKELKK